MPDDEINCSNSGILEIFDAKNSFVPIRDEANTSLRPLFHRLSAIPAPDKLMTTFTSDKEDSSISFKEGFQK